MILLLSSVALSVMCDPTFDGSPMSFLRSQDKTHRFMSSIFDVGQCSDETNTVVSNMAVSLPPSDVPRLKKEYFETYCPGYPNENTKELTCDFQPLSTRDDWYSESICQEAGGKLLMVPLELCNYTVPITNDFSTFEAVERIYMNNLPLCAGLACGKEQLSQYLLDIYEPLDLKCPAAPSSAPSHSPSLPPSLEGRYAKFALRYDINNTLLTRSCNWLRMKPETNQTAICEKKYYQLYADGFFPASQVCFETCMPYCVEQALNAKFVLENFLDSSGQIVEEIRQCKWLEKKSSDEINLICSAQIEFHSRYGKAEEVCTSLCPDSPKACTP